MIEVEKSYRNRLNGMNFIDLFCGLGGFRLAFESYGAKCVFSSDIDKFVQETYKNNYNELPQGDITKINEKDIPKHDILCAGFPCQAFSISGKRKGFEDVRGTLFFDIVRIAKYHKPKVMLLENVKNLQKHDNGNTFKVITEIIKGIGYTPFYKVLSASNYGIPQSRERIYIVCIRNDFKIESFKFPTPISKDVCVEDILIHDGSEEQYKIKNKEFIINDIKAQQENFLNINKPIRIRVCQ